MANSVYVSYTTTGAKTPISMNYFQTPFNATVGVYVGTTATYGVEYTLDDVNNSAITVRWFADANLGTGTTTSGTTNYMFPVRFVRLNIAAITGAVDFKVLQGLTP